MKTREEGRVCRAAVVVVTAVSADGPHEILGLDVFTSEDEAAWSAFLGDLTSCGLSGVQLVIIDDHRGLTRAIDSLLPGAGWRQIWSNNPQERPSRQFCRRSDAVGILPNGGVIVPSAWCSPSSTKSWPWRVAT